MMSFEVRRYGWSVSLRSTSIRYALWVEFMHEQMSAVIGLEIRAAGSRRGQPHSPKVHTKQRMK